MAVQRLTYFFITSFPEEPVQIPVTGGKAIPGIIFASGANFTEGEQPFQTPPFPFTFDEQLSLPRPVRNTDIVRNDDGIPIGLSVEVTSEGRYNDRDWFVGLGINGQEVWNGIPRPTTENGIEYQFKNASIAVIDSGFFPDGRGYVSISSEESNIGILDNVEILIKNAKTKTPWIYYGNIPQRQELALNQFGRNPSGMGGVPESLTPSQGMGYEYFVDFNASNSGGVGTVPFFTPIVLPPTAGGTSSFSDRFFMGDILDGDGRLAVRSLTTFKIFSIGQNLSLGGAEVPVFQIINTGAFRTLNYKEMEYETTSYIPQPVVENTRFYLSFQSSEKFNDIYSNIAETLYSLLFYNIDFNTCTFNIYTYIGSSGAQVSLDITGRDSLVSAINSLSASSNTEENNHSLSSLNALIRSKIAEDAQIDFEAGNFNEKNYSQIVFGDMNFNTSQQPLANQTVTFAQGDGELSVPITTLGTHILLATDEDDEKGEGIFGDLLTFIFGFKESSVYGFQFLESLARGSGLVLSEDDLYREFEFLHAPFLKLQAQSVLATINEPDRDNDGRGTYLDRIIGLYQNFNPSIDLGEESFFGSRGVEMRFWRRICPIGQLYSFYGTIASQTQVRGGNFLLEVDVLAENPDYTPDGEEPRFIDTGVENNRIYVYYENGAQSNVANNDGTGIFNFKGRFFSPDYWKNGVQIANGVNLSDPDELSAWYRILPDSSRDLLDPGLVPENEPVIIVRTNVAGGADPTSADGQGPISNVFLDRSDRLSFYKISQFAERIEDHIVSINNSEEGGDVELATVGSGKVVFQSPTDSSRINFQSIEFEIEIPEATDLYGEFEYEIYWKSSLSSEEFTLRKFWSAFAFANNVSPSENAQAAAKAEISLNGTFSLYCVPSWQTNDSNRGQIFDIVFPYKEHQNSDDGIRHFFRWNEGEYAIQVTLNENTLSSGFNTPITEVQASVNPTIGQVFLRDPIRSTDALYITFINITGNQNFQKTGTTLGIRLVSTPRTGNPENTPVIRNVKVNQSSLTTSVERVDGNYYNPGGIAVNRDHFMAPAHGFAVLSGRNWDLAIDDRNSTAGGGGNVRITGSLVSPIWFFDAFETDLSKKLVSEESSRDLVAIDRVYSNMVSIFSQPFVEILSIGFTPPPPEIIPRVTSIYDKIMQRYTIAYNVDNNIEMKFSHTGFRDRDSIYGNFDERNRSQRRQIGMYTAEEREEFLSNSTSFSTSSSENPDAVLVGLRLRGGITRAKSPIQNTGVLELFANISGTVVPFGYRQFNGDRLGLLCGFTDDGGDQKGLVQLPLTVGIDSMQFQTYDNAEFGAFINEIAGVFVDGYVEAQSPTLYKTPFGTYLVLFSQQENGVDLITGLVSREQTFRWSRPATRTGEQNAFSPVAILTGYINPLILQQEESGMVHVFLYNNQEQAIDLLSIPYTAFERFSVGVDEDEEEYAQEAEENNVRGYADLIRDPESSSWKRVFSEGRALYPVVFSATQDYSAVLTADGGVYLASVSTSGELRLLYSPASGAGEFSPNTWLPFGVDILDPEGHLGKIVDAANVYCIALSSNPGGGTLELFITTVDNRLILFRVPTALTSIAGRLAEINDELFEKLQEEVNDTVPILVVGNNPQTTEDINAGGAISEDFPNQLPSIQWFPNGELYVVYYKDSSIKGIKSTTGGVNWRVVEEI